MVGAGVPQISLQEIKLLGTHEIYIRWWSGLVASLIIGYFKKQGGTWRKIKAAVREKYMCDIYVNTWILWYIKYCHGM